MERNCKFWTCTMCGRCYTLRGFSLTKASEAKMIALEKSWLKQGELLLCCREGHDSWRIAMKMKKKDKK